MLNISVLSKNLSEKLSENKFKAMIRLIIIINFVYSYNYASFDCVYSIQNMALR